MALTASGTKKKLTITACNVDASGNVTLEDASFQVMLNPGSYKHEYAISYNKDKALGQQSAESKFSVIGPEKINFKIMLDGTGVVNEPGPAGAALPDVKDQIASLRDVVYKYDGEDHEPNHVRLLWGSFLFYGRLTSMKVDYKMFKPSGEPLRAEIDLAFTGFVSKEEEALRANRSSPDLTHVVEVKSGDTLPLLCSRVYNDSSYYLAVAEVNGIAHFRDIKPGQKLYFPPLS